MSCFDFMAPPAPKIEKAPPPPAETDPAVGEAELKRKRASAAAFGRKSTIATSGSGVTGPSGVKITTTTGYLS